MGGLAAGTLADLRSPRLAPPIGQMRRRLPGHAFPPYVAVIGKRDVGEDHVSLQHGHGVRVGLI